jgi:plasmid stabilization system protein ParE
MSIPLYAVAFTPEALHQLEDLYGYIADAASPMVAQRYTDAIVTYCESLQVSPLRGTSRDDIRYGLRITNYKGRAVIAFDVSENQVSIIGIFYGGYDYESALNSPDTDSDVTQ